MHQQSTKTIKGCNYFKTGLHRRLLWKKALLRSVYTTSPCGFHIRREDKKRSRMSDEGRRWTKYVSTYIYIYKILLKRKSDNFVNVYNTAIIYRDKYINFIQKGESTYEVKLIIK